MSRLGLLTGKAERDQLLLSRLNEAVITLEVEALGRTKELDLSEEEVEQARRLLAEFIEKLKRELEQRDSTADLHSLAFRIQGTVKPLQDWQQDLASLHSQLTKPGPIPVEDLPILEEILSLLDTEFVDDLKRLYAH